jgi:hypothetical protein
LGRYIDVDYEAKMKRGRERMHFRLPIAVGHVHAAIQLFNEPGLEGSVLHLASAADEIFEAFLRRDGKRTMSESLLLQFQRYMPGLDRKAFHRDSTRWKNAVKHADVPGEDVITMPSLHPFQFLVRAIMNYKSLTGELTPQMDEFMARHRKS